MSLSLKEFITSALVDINEAVKDASNSGVHIAYQQYKTGNHPTIKAIEFDIAVELTESSSNSKSSSSGLQLSILNLGGEKSKNNKSDSKNVNRIKFSVDTFLGMSNDTQQDTSE